MPAYTRNKKRKNLVWVPVNEFTYFGFKTKDFSSVAGITTSDITALGHIAAGNEPLGFIKIIGAQAPHPPRVSKKIPNAQAGQQKTVSTYCGYLNLTSAQNSRWNIIQSRKSVLLRSASAYRGSLTAIAELSNGALYCFPMNKSDFELYGGELGLKSSATVTTNARKAKLVSGSSIPYPGKASKLLDDGSTFASFFSTASQGTISTAGYDIVQEERVILLEEPPF